MLSRIFTTLTVGLLCCFASAQEEATPSSTFPKPAIAEDAWRPHVGLMAGFSDTEGEFDSALEYGIDVGFQPYIPFGLGFELSSSSSEVKYGVLSDELERTKLLVKGTYNFGGQIVVIKDSYVGLGIGPMLESIGNSDDLYIGIAPMAGFDIPLKRQPREFISLGANARYLISSSGNPNAFAVNGVMKYWF